MRTIRKYANRKLYDTQEGHYVSLSDIAGLIRAGEDLRVQEYRTERDLTAIILAEIIFEEEKRGPRLHVEELRRIIRSGLPL